MKTRKLAVLYVVTCALLLCSPGRAQQLASPAPTELREVISKLEAVDNDPGTPPEVRELNARFLGERRAQLKLLLTKRMVALKKYRATVGATLSAAEQQVIDSSIITIEQELVQTNEAASRPTAGVTRNEVLVASIGGLPEMAPTASDARSFRAHVTAAAPALSRTMADDTQKNGESEQAGGAIAVDRDFKDTERAIDPNGAVNLAKLPALFTETFGSVPDKNIPFIIHIVVWKKGDNDFSTDSDTWYLYRDGKLLLDEDGSTRIYGSKTVGVLLVHVNALKTWDINYKLKATKKIPANIADVQRLAELVLRAEAAAPIRTGLWGGKIAKVPTPSDIKLTAKVDIRDDQDKRTQDAVAFNSQVYDDEGRYHWDVSVGLPVQGVKEVQYKAEDGVVRPREVKRENAYGFLNVFPMPVDVKGDDWLRPPHLVLGVPITGKPLDRPVIGAGMGIGKKNLFVFDLYAGAVFNLIREPSSLTTGAAATENQLESDLRSRRVTKFIFGANLPVSTFTKLLDKK